MNALSGGAATASGVHVALVLLAVLAVPACRAQAAAPVKVSLDGTWVVSDAEVQDRPFEAIRGSVLRIDGRQFALRTSGGRDLTGTLRIGEAGNPQTLDLLLATGETWLALFEVSGDSLRLVYAVADAGHDRPAAFTTDADSPATLVHLRRSGSGPEVAPAAAVPARPVREDDRQRDLRDHPAEVLAFLGIGAGMAVLDLNSAAGYYTAHLSRAVGPQGHVIAHNHPSAVAMLGEEVLGQRYAYGRLPNVEQLLVRHQDLKPPPESLDAVLMSMVYHDLYWYDPEVDWGPVEPVEMLKALYAALKPGGVVGVIDHVAKGDTDPAATAMALHRIDPEVVRRDFLRAGFVHEAGSQLLSNPQDDHSLGVFDPAVHGRTDRFLMRFRKPAEWKLPAGVPPPRVPPDNPMTPERVQLGRHLFFDARLSGNGTQSCASCHIQLLAFTDGRAQPVGSTGQVHPRSSMSLVNAAYRDSLNWADPTLRELEPQILIPLTGTAPVEMGLGGNEQKVFARLAGDPVYAALFAAAFAGEADPINLRNIDLALAAFVRSIVSFRSPFDRFRFEGDQAALSPAARRGWQLFLGPKARCGGCHMAQNVPVDLGLNLDGGSKSLNSPADEPAVFLFHNTGLYDLPGPTSYPADNTGLFQHTGVPADMGRFRVPTLRNIAATAPYMHDGSIQTLQEVLDHYVAGGRAPDPALLSESIKPLQLTAAERSDLIAFLLALTDEEVLVDPRFADPWPAARPPGH